MQKLTRSLLAVGAVIGLAACGDDVTVTPPTPPAAPTVTGVTVSPASTTIKIGESVTFSASLQTTGTVTNTAVTWSSADPTKASVSASGAVLGVAVGTTTIRATSAANPSASGAGSVTVVAPGVQSVSVTPNAAAVTVGQSFTAVANVTRDAGVAGTVTWASSAALVASVSAAGVVTGVAPGTAVVTATSTADVTKSASLSVTVTQQANALQSLTVTPSTVNIGPGGTLTLTTITQAATGATVTYANTSSNLAAATVTSTGANAVITGVSNGSAVITITATGTGAGLATNSISQTVTVNIAAASVSISSLTTCIGTPTCTVVPVNLAGVTGQIEATLNITSGSQQIDSVTVSIGSVQAASQVFGNSGAPSAPVTLSMNTAGFNPTTFVPKWINGPQTLVAKIYPHDAGSPTASNTVQFTLINTDVVYFDVTGLAHTGNSASDIGGGVWWKGGFTYQSHPVSYSGQIASITYFSSSCGSATGTVAPSYQATFSCSGVEGSQSIGGVIAVTYNPGYTLSLPPTAFMTAATPGFVPGSPVYAVVASNEDNVGPAIAVGTVAFNDLFDQPWVNASYAFAQDFTITDGGVGVDGAATVTRLVTVTGCDGATATTGNDLAETVSSSGVPDGYSLCAVAYDKLSNGTTSGGSNFFGVDKVAPGVRAAGSTVATPTIAPSTVASASVSATPNTTIYNILMPFTATDVWGLEGIDTRAGFNQNAVAGFPATQSMGFLSPTGSLTCAGFTGPLSVVLSDNWVRTTTLEPLDCASALPGYYTYSGYVVDRAGNASTTIDRNFAIDQYAAPILSALLPAAVNYTAGSPASFNIYGTDDLEVIEADLTVTYPGYPFTLTYPANALSNGIRWDAFLNNVVTASSVTINSWLGRFDRTCTGVGAPYASCAAADGIATVALDYNNVGTFTDNEKNPTGVASVALDVGSNPSGSVAQALSPLITNDIPQAWVGADIVTFKIVTGSSIIAEHKASTSIAVPFFDAVYLARVNVGGTSITLCGLYPAPVRTDNGTNRFYTYTLVTPAAGACATGGNWLAVGLKGPAALATTDVP